MWNRWVTTIARDVEHALGALRRVPRVEARVVGEDVLGRDPALSNAGASCRPRRRRRGCDRRRAGACRPCLPCRGPPPPRSGPRASGWVPVGHHLGAEYERGLSARNLVGVVTQLRPPSHTSGTGTRRTTSEPGRGRERTAFHGAQSPRQMVDVDLRPGPVELQRVVVERVVERERDAPRRVGPDAVDEIGPALELGVVADRLRDRSGPRTPVRIGWSRSRPSRSRPAGSGPPARAGGPLVVLELDQRARAAHRRAVPAARREVGHLFQRLPVPVRPGSRGGRRPPPTGPGAWLDHDLGPGRDVAPSSRGRSCGCRRGPARGRCGRRRRAPAQHSGERGARHGPARQRRASSTTA